LAGTFSGLTGDDGLRADGVFLTGFGGGEDGVGAVATIGDVDVVGFGVGTTGFASSLAGTAAGLTGDSGMESNGAFPAGFAAEPLPAEPVPALTVDVAVPGVVAFFAAEPVAALTVGVAVAGVVLVVVGAGSVEFDGFFAAGFAAEPVAALTVGVEALMTGFVSFVVGAGSVGFSSVLCNSVRSEGVLPAGGAGFTAEPIAVSIADVEALTGGCVEGSAPAGFEDGSMAETFAAPTTGK